MSGCMTKEVITSESRPDNTSQSYEEVPPSIEKVTVFFDFDKSSPRTGEVGALDNVVREMKDYPETTITVEGHADSRGSKKYNRHLSRARAINVKNYLTRHHIDPGRIEVVAFGETKPKCKKEGNICWGQNRRVEVVFRN